MTAVANFNLALDQGATYTNPFTWTTATGTAVNLTGCTASAMFRSPDVTGAAPLLTLTSSSGIVLGGAAGTVVLTISAAQTAALFAALVQSAGVARGAWDMMITFPDTSVTKFLSGSVTVAESVTR